jgi:hypothetical protein
MEGFILFSQAFTRVSQEEIGQSNQAKFLREGRKLSAFARSILAGYLVSGHALLRPHVSKTGKGTARLVLQLTNSPQSLMDLLLEHFGSFCQLG